VHKKTGGNKVKVLVLNGSAKGEKSNTMKLTRAFIEGMAKSEELDTEILQVYKMNIKPCLGCFACWRTTPGKCVIKDDMESIIEKFLSNDLIIWSFPLYYFNLPSQLKALLDRLLPMNLPFMEQGKKGIFDSGSHSSRYNLSGKKYVLISTCGFYTTEGNYDSVKAMFDRFYGKNEYEFLCSGQGELFRVPELRSRTDIYLDYVRIAGSEFIGKGISEASREKLFEPLYPRDAFEKMANSSWGVEMRHKENTEGELIHITQSEARDFTTQMAALYNKSAWNGKDIVLEMDYPDIGERYQIILAKDGSSVLSEGLIDYTTKITTSLSLWQKIARGEIEGQQAMMDKLYRVDGDFSLMLNWEKFFGLEDTSSTKESSLVRDEKGRNMAILILLWMGVWVGIAIDPFVGGIISISLAAMLPIVATKWDLTVFEHISGALVSLFGMLSILGLSSHFVVPASYLAFGMIWMISSFMKVPLTAYYSMYGYGGQSALSNPLFLKTNRILTSIWGGLYLITPIWTYFLMVSPLGKMTGIINSAIPAILGIFTAWFQKWYPENYTRL
jgi:multimeric flavodoxin WrbA